ncbi:MAG: FG-GAP repeat protein, partial [Candidatus Uhrbacteria bacterium GW2011_GWF2_46_218]
TVAATTGLTTIAGAADGTDALVLTLGDILVTNGDLDLSGGDFNVNLDDGDSVNIDGDTSPTLPLLVLGNGDTAVASGVDALQIALNQAAGASADGVDITSTIGAQDGSDYYQAIDINITGANHSGAGNSITGIDLDLTTPDADSVETAIDIGANWDIGLNMNAGGEHQAISIDAALTDSTHGTTGIISMIVDQAANNANTMGMQLNYEVLEEASAGNNANTHSIIDVTGTMTSNDGDHLYGINVANLGGTASTGNEVALSIGSGWDTGINLKASAASTALNIDGGTDDQTTDLVTIDLDVNSATVDGIYLDADVGTALSGGERVNAVNIEVTGLAGDDVTSAITGIQMVGDTTSAGTVTGMVLGGSWDVGLSVLSDNLRSITFADPGDFAMGHADAIYTGADAVAENGVKFDIDMNNEIFVFETDNGVSNFNMLFGTGIDDTEVAEADRSGVVFMIADVTTPDDLFIVDASGAIFSDSASAVLADFAEYMLDSDGDLEAGELVSVDVNNAQAVVRTTTATDSKLMGIVSTNPGFIANAPSGRQVDEDYVPIAFMGQVPVKVGVENGAIAIGDYITSSSIPGVGMKADVGDPTVAIALETDADGDGIILSLVSRNNGYSLQGSSSTLTAVSSDSLEVAGDASFGGSVTVAEHLYGSKDMAGRARMAAGHDYVHVAFTQAYEDTPVITFSSRSDAEAMAGYQYWVGDESATGFTIYASGWNDQVREFSWIAMGVVDGVVTISDGTTSGFDGEVTVTAPVVEEPAPVEEPVVEEPVVEEPAPVEEPVVEEPVVEEPVVEEPAPEAPAEVIE